MQSLAYRERLSIALVINSHITHASTRISITTDSGITNPIFSQEISALGISEPPIGIVMVVSIPMAMVPATHPVSVVSVGVLNKVQICGLIIQHNGRIATVMGMAIMVRLVQPIPISSPTISPLLKTTIATVIPTVGLPNTMAPMLWD